MICCFFLVRRKSACVWAVVVVGNPYFTPPVMNEPALPLNDENAKRPDCSSFYPQKRTSGL